MTTTQFRALAIVLKGKISELYNRVAPLYENAKDWRLNSEDCYLPAQGDVRAMYNVYTTLQVDPLSLADCLLSLQAVNPTDPRVFFWTLDPLVVFTIDPFIIF